MARRYDERMRMITDQEDFDPFQIELMTKIFDPVEF
jgi:hypothetical protein